MWKNSLKNVESDNNKILYETLFDFLQWNGTYFLNKPRNTVCSQTALSSVYIPISVSEFFVITSGEERSSSYKDSKFREKLKIYYEI